MAAVLAGIPEKLDATSEPSWDISPIVLEDAAHLAHFYAHFESESRPEEFWRERLRLWWQANPAFTPDWNMGFKMVSGGNIVGVLCAVPVRILHQGKPVVGAALTSWRVHKEYRAGSISLLEEALAAHQGKPIFDTTPTAGVVRLLNHYGFDRPREHFPAARLLANPARLVGKFLGIAPASIQSSLHFIDDSPTTVDTAVDLAEKLWQRSPQPFETTVVRDGAYYRWYCESGRTNGRAGVIITDPAGSPTGMGVILDMGKGVSWLVDLWCDSSHSTATKKLLQSARKCAARMGFHCLWVPHFNKSVADVCSLHTNRKLPVSAFFKLPGGTPPSGSSYWTIAVGDFGA